jgi:hypothetical protein
MVLQLLPTTGLISLLELSIGISAHTYNKYIDTHISLPKANNNCQEAWALLITLVFWESCKCMLDTNSQIEFHRCQGVWVNQSDLDYVTLETQETSNKLNCTSFFEYSHKRICSSTTGQSVR